MLIKWKDVKAPLWERAPFFRLLLPFIAGIVCYDRVGSDLMLHYVLTTLTVAVLCAGLAVLATWRPVRFLGLKPAGFVAVWLLLSLAGYTVSYLGDIRNDKDWFGKQRAPFFLVVVRDHPQMRETTWRIPVSVTAALVNGNGKRVEGDAYLYVSRDSLRLPADRGDTLMIPGKWAPVRNAGNPYEFDYAAFCRRNNIFFRQYCKPQQLRLFGKGSVAGQPFTVTAHDWAADRLRSAVKDSLSVALVDAMVLGDESELDPELTRSWSAAGIVHVIAISGGNVMIFFWVVSGLFVWIRNNRYRWLKFLLAVPAVWFYVLMAGASPSAIRAAVMFTFLSAVLVFGQRNNPLNQLFGSAFLMLLCQPEWLFSIGFQLSFVAVLSLILFYDRIFQFVRPGNRWVRLLWETIAASLAAEVLVAPLVIYYYHNFPVLFLVANVVAWVFMGFVQLAAMLLVFAGNVPFAGDFLATATVRAVVVFNHFIDGLNRLNPEMTQRISLSAPELWTVYAAIGGFAFFLLRKSRKGLFAGLAALNILAALGCWREWAHLRQNFFVVYNTGKSIYVECVKGKFCYAVAADSFPLTRAEYLSRSAHIQWHVNDPWRAPGWNTGGDCLIVAGGYTLLVCQNAYRYHDRFPVDYVYVKGMRVDPVHLDSVFIPRKIILRSWRQAAGYWQTKRARDLRARIFVLQKQGAFVKGDYLNQSVRFTSTSSKPSMISPTRISE